MTGILVSLSPASRAGTPTLDLMVSIHDARRNFSRRQEGLPSAEGVPQGSRIFVVGTDVVAYKEKLEALTGALRTLAFHSVDRGRNSLMDSLGMELRTVRR